MSRMGQCALCSGWSVQDGAIHGVQDGVNGQCVQDGVSTIHCVQDIEPVSVFNWCHLSVSGMSLACH